MVAVTYIDDNLKERSFMISFMVIIHSIWCAVFCYSFFVVPFLSSEADGSCQEALRLQPTLRERWNLRVNNWFEWRADSASKSVENSRHAKTNQISFCSRKYRYKPRLLDSFKPDLQTLVTFLRVLQPWQPAGFRQGGEEWPEARPQLQRRKVRHSWNEAMYLEMYIKSTSKLCNITEDEQ